MSDSSSILVWFRRDLRWEDHAALSAALRRRQRVYCVFVFDRTILDALPDKADRRVEFILASLTELDQALREHGGALHIAEGDPRQEIPRLAAAWSVDQVFANRDYEPSAIERDRTVEQALADDGRSLQLFKDQVIFEQAEVMTGAGTPYSVFTPYKNAWLRQLRADDLKSHPVELTADLLARPPGPASELPALSSLGFQSTDLRTLGIPTGVSGGQRLFADFQTRIDAYHERRDYPSVLGPSYLSVHLRFGTVSIRRLADFAWRLAAADPDAAAGASTWLGELIWRDFYHQILFHHPQVVNHAFKPEYDAIRWERGAQADELFDAWCRGATGYPLVDAAQRQLLYCGYMHNRLRMVSASFLVKDLGIDWRRGERFFARHLIDYDLAANNGGWQWAASTGCDAQPWFRIFNPITQSKKFDASARFIKRYVPELQALPDDKIHAPWLLSNAVLEQAGIVIGRGYPAPIVDHDVARKRTLERFGAVKG